MIALGSVRRYRERAGSAASRIDRHPYSLPSKPFTFAAADLNVADVATIARVHRSEGHRLGGYSKKLEMQHLEHAKAGKADEDEIDGNEQIEKTRHQQDQDARDQRHDRLDMRCRDDH